MRTEIAPLALSALAGVVGARTFHRRHHAIGVGHEGRFHGCNFAVLFPLWDQLFGTADFCSQVGPTGFRDQREGPDGGVRDHGQGSRAPQCLGLQQMLNLARSP